MVRRLSFIEEFPSMKRRDAISPPFAAMGPPSLSLGAQQLSGGRQNRGSLCRLPVSPDGVVLDAKPGFYAAAKVMAAGS